jgi:hypothetical protein
MLPTSLAPTKSITHNAPEEEGAAFAMEAALTNELRLPEVPIERSKARLKAQDESFGDQRATEAGGRILPLVDDAFGLAL